MKSDGGDKKVKYMSENIIERKSGKYGRVQITLPLETKKIMIEWKNKSGLKQSEFFRTALMICASQLAWEYSQDEAKMRQ